MIEQRVSVGSLVDVAFRTGDLRVEFSGFERMREGVRGHKTVQSSRPEGYRAEVPVEYTITDRDVVLILQGRIDGILEEPDRVTLEEIKTLTHPPEPDFEGYPSHWAQARVYAFIWCSQNDLPDITIRLTYYHIPTRRTLELENQYSRKNLEQFLAELTQKIIANIRRIAQWQAIRDASIATLEFPFPRYRPHQRELAVKVWRTINSGKNLFVHAPTGTGKTIAVLFPAIKSITPDTRLFYLTARNTNQEVAEVTFEVMREHGLRIRICTLTAKERICFQEEMVCLPEVCPYAEGFFDRLDDAVAEAWGHDRLDRATIEEIARKHRVCPFEFSLEVALFCDGVICDYNYAFDPRVQLKRFFMIASGRYIFIVDEAHNLPDRAREMYSASLSKREILQTRRMTKEVLPDIYRALGKVNRNLLNRRKELEGSKYTERASSEKPSELLKAIRSTLAAMDKWLARGAKTPFQNELLDTYFQLLAFQRIGELYGPPYTTIDRRIGSGLETRMFCLDPAPLLKKTLKMVHSGIFFSGTLLPTEYFCDLSGGEIEDNQAVFPTIFPRENLFVLIADQVSTLYRDRENSAVSLAEMIQASLDEVPGNLLVFFPSYRYMNQILVLVDAPGREVLVQQPGMSPEERLSFLQMFRDRKDNLAGFAVMGGIFGEGIDLVGDALMGAIIVGVGLPQICIERDSMRHYFDEAGCNGFERAYQIPGMNRVMQAAGRVIRSETDRGMILLIDHRFTQSRYRRLFPDSWHHWERIEDREHLRYQLRYFFGQGAGKIR